MGKETTNLDVVNMIGITGEDNYTIYDNLAEKILDIRSRDTYKFGISRSNIISIQKKRMNLDLKTKNVLYLGDRSNEKSHVMRVRKKKRDYGYGSCCPTLISSIHV